MAIVFAGLGALAVVDEASQWRPVADLKRKLHCASGKLASCTAIRAPVLLRCPEFLLHPSKDRLKFVVFLAAISVIFFGSFIRFWQLAKPVVWEVEVTTMLCVAGKDRYKVREKIITGSFATFRKTLQQPAPGMPISRVIRAIPPLYGPLNPVLIYMWGKVAGYRIGSARVVSAIVGTIVIAAAFWLGMELFKSAWAALLAATMVSISPMVIHYSREAREPILGIFFTIVVAAAFLRALRSQRCYRGINRDTIGMQQLLAAFGSKSQGRWTSKMHLHRNEQSQRVADVIAELNDTLLLILSLTKASKSSSEPGLYRTPGAGNSVSH
ncbi:MAG: glycosyltransferase family 39 protein [Candidatus Obscuribacterales bacterium]|nr:glycosyltransferase family 39 protein [Candidatus Obscuribacterales bacterium]